MLSEVLPVIRWGPGQDHLLNRAEDDYGRSLAASLGGVLARLDTSAPALAAQLMTELADTDTVMLRRVLLAPETSCRLLWSGNDEASDADLATFIVGALDVEQARRTGEPPRRRPLHGRVWSALGDTCFDSERRLWLDQSPLLGLTIDATSPAVEHFDGALRVGEGLVPYADTADKESALGKLQAAMGALDAVSETVANFVRKFTLVANVVVDSDMDRFSSGSTNQYIGRSIFWNSHAAAVDVGTVAEALVHEAVHSLLFMHNVCTPWLPTDVDPAKRIVSPWSGAKLPVEPFLQACFVWYALYHFWTVASGSGIFPAERTELGRTTARRGFTGAKLVELAPDGIALEVMSIINGMQADIRTAGGDSPTAVHQ